LKDLHWNATPYGKPSTGSDSYKYWEELGVCGEPIVITPPDYDCDTINAWVNNPALTSGYPVGTIVKDGNVVWECISQNYFNANAYGKPLGGADSDLYWQAMGPCKETGGTPIRDIPKTGRKHGVIVDKNPVTGNVAKISVRTPEKTTVKLSVLDNAGNVLFEAAGIESGKEISWNLTNKAGRIVANGSYLVIAEGKDAKGKSYRYSAKIGVKR
jgi:hypothetical protein